MSVLAGIPHDQHINSIRRAADALVAESRRLQLGPTWSICELQLTPEDLKWLNDWAASLRVDQIALTLGQDSRLPVVGLVLLSFAAETCRRDGRERGIYEVFADGPFSDEVRAILLSSMGYPRKQVQVALEQACRIFGLRHAFDSPTTQPWYLTTKLQFGFTLQGSNDELEDWLTGHAPTAIKWLLDGEPQSNHSGTPIRSESFRRLWDMLGRFRGNRVSESEARRAITESPWVLAEWAESLLEVAGRPISGSGYAYIPIADRDEAQRRQVDEWSDEDFDAEPIAVGSPKVHWHNGEAALTVRYDEAFLSQLGGDCFFVSVDDEPCDVLRRQVDGSYSNVGGDLMLPLAVDRETAMVSIADENGQGIVSQPIELLDHREDFQAYGQNGSRVPLRQLSTQRGYTLRLPAGTQFKPDIDLQVRWTNGASWWVQLSPGWSDEATIRLPGESFDLQLLSRCESHGVDWTDSISQQPTAKENAAGRFQVSFSAPPEVTILDVRICGEPVDFQSLGGGKYQTDAVSSTRLRHDGQCTLRIVAQREKVRVVYRDFQVEREGLLIFDRGVWKNHRATEPLDATRLSRTQVVFRLGNAGREEGWSLLEGSTKRQFRVEKPLRLSDLGCRGWPLKVTDHLYNRVSGSSVKPLSSGVVDQGIVLTGVQRPGSRLVSISLRESLELSADHHIALWARSGRLANIASSQIQSTAGDWIVDPADAGIDYDDLIVAAAVAYRGTRLGSFWSEDWWRPVTRVCDTATATETAACLRWFCLPLMQRQGDIRNVASGFGSEFLRQWCLPSLSGPAFIAEHCKTEQFLASDLLKQNDEEPNWFATTRHLLEDWNPTPEEAIAIAPIPWLDGDDNNANTVYSVEQIVGSLATSMPVIVARFMRAWFAFQNNPNDERVLRYMLARDLAKDLEHRAKVQCQRLNEGDPIELRRLREHGFNPDDLHPTLPWLLLGKGFVDSLVTTAKSLVERDPVSDLDRDNLESAFNSPELCRYVAAQLIAAEQGVAELVKSFV
ncbi:MAG: hypothetical protein SGJ20_07110 [Planctomycetota bacterium]|nr:hypothetical protein [Planctomycetota bacterium]